jgi:hypothetical protein
MAVLESESAKSGGMCSSKKCIGIGESVNAISKRALDGLVKEREPPSLKGDEIDPCPVRSKERSRL